MNSLEAIREMTHLHIVGVERSKRAGPGPSQSARKQSTSETTGPAPGGQGAVNIFGKSELDIQTYTSTRRNPNGMDIATPSVVNKNLSNVIDSYSEVSKEKCRNSSDAAYVNVNGWVSYQVETSMFEPCQRED